MTQDKKNNDDKVDLPPEINLDNFDLNSEGPSKNSTENFGINNELWNNKEFLDELQKNGHVSLKFTTKKDSDGLPSLNYWSNIDNPERFGLIPGVNNIYKQFSSESDNSIHSPQSESNPYVEILPEPDSDLIRIIVELPGILAKDIELEEKGKLLVLQAITNNTRYYKELIIGKEIKSFHWTFNKDLLEITIVSK